MSNHRFLLNHFMFQNISMMGLARLCVKSPCCSCSGPQFVSCTHVRSLTTRCDSSTSSHDSAMGGTHTPYVHNQEFKCSSAASMHLLDLGGSKKTRRKNPHRGLLTHLNARIQDNLLSEQWQITEQSVSEFVHSSNILKGVPSSLLGKTGKLPKKNIYFLPDVMAHVFNPSIWEAKTAGSSELRLA